MIRELTKDLFGSVRRRRQPVGAQPDPREERDEREVAMDAGVEWILRPAEEDGLKFAIQGRGSNVSLRVEPP
jgi:hypothetical protein